MKKIDLLVWARHEDGVSGDMDWFVTNLPTGYSECEKALSKVPIEFSWVACYKPYFDGELLLSDEQLRDGMVEEKLVQSTIA